MLECNTIFPSPQGRSIIGVWDFIALTTNLFFSFIFTCKWGMMPPAALTLPQRNSVAQDGSCRPAPLFSHITCCLYLQEAVIMLLRLPTLSPTQAYAPMHTHVHPHMQFHNFPYKTKSKAYRFLTNYTKHDRI